MCVLVFQLFTFPPVVAHANVCVSLCFSCLHSHQLLPKLMFACQKYLKDEQLETPMGLVARLVLSNNIFVEQFCATVKDLKVSTCVARKKYGLS